MNNKWLQHNDSTQPTRDSKHQACDFNKVCFFWQNSFHEHHIFKYERTIIWFSVADVYTIYHHNSFGLRSELKRMPRSYMNSMAKRDFFIFHSTQVHLYWKCTFDCQKLCSRENLFSHTWLLRGHRWLRLCTVWFLLSLNKWMIGTPLLLMCYIDKTR